jgi:rubrerythrin
MHKDINTEIGLNRTGTMMAPIESKKSAKGALELTNPNAGDASALAANRILFMQEAEQVGTLPIPLSLKGVVSSIQEKLLSGNNAFLDKLGERLAFERTGTRLYEALLSKFNAASDKALLPELTRLEQFYLEELKHFHLVTDAMEKIGGDPTAVTPAADLSGVAAQGWLQVISDPRTNFLQSLEVILQAELVDNAGWELLIELAESSGAQELAVQFQQALDEEAFHLMTVKRWVQELTLHQEILTRTDERPIDTPEQ